MKTNSRDPRKGEPTSHSGHVFIFFSLVDSTPPLENYYCMTTIVDVQDDRIDLNN